MSCHVNIKKHKTNYWFLALSQMYPSEEFKLIPKGSLQDIIKTINVFPKPEILFSVKCGLESLLSLLIRRPLMVLKTCYSRYYKNIFINDLVSAYWRKLLLLSTPHLILGVQPSQMLCKAAHDLKIPIYDIQHGHFSVSSKYYSSLETRTSDSKPDGILCWDPRSARAFMTYFGFSGLKTFVVGNPNLLPLPNNLPSRTSQRHNDSSKKCILLSLGYGMTKKWDKKTIGLPPQLLIRCIKFCELNDLNLVIRPHPTSISKYSYKNVRKALIHTIGPHYTDRIQIENTHCVHILDYKSNVIAHIGNISSVSIELALLGIPSLMYSGNILGERHLYSKHQSDYDLIKYFESIDQLFHRLALLLDTTICKDTSCQDLVDTHKNLSRFIDKFLRLNS